MTKNEKPLGATDTFISIDGHPFERDSLVWHLNRDINLRLSGLKKELDDKIFISARNVLAYFACNYSAAHTNNMCSEYLRLVQFANGRPISADVLASYMIILRDKVWRLGPVRVFMRRWKDLGYDGLDLKALDFIERSSIKGNPKGEAVKSLNPSAGPFTDIELLGINEAITQGYETGELGISDLAMSLLLSGFGIRAVQLTSLRGRDIIESKNKEGDPIYAILIPRAKQTCKNFRSNFKKRRLNKDIWDVLERQKSYVAQKFKSLLNLACPEYLCDELPLFPNWKTIAQITDLKDLTALLSNDHLHRTSQSVNTSLRQAIKKLRINSERTGETLHLTSRRFRYTLGSRAAREGHGPLVIAELLDHSDLQNVMVYTENLPEFATHLNEVLFEQLAPYANAFAGTIIDSQIDAVRGHDPTSKIRAPSGQGAGNCGYYGPCGANVPIPCYTCIHFEAWVTGPHKSVCEHLMSERNRLAKLTGDETIAATLDRSILAVTQVINACEARLNHSQNEDEDL